jgi:type IX secretion system PorP/SprF family membrane protein
MKRKLILFFIQITTFLSAQELHLPIVTQYLDDNPFAISPSFAGIGDNFRINVNAYKQWTGITDSPQNQSFYTDLRVLSRSGIGLSLYNDKNGNTIQAGGKLTFAHHIILDYYSKQYLSFGLSYIVNTFKIDIANLDPIDPDPIITNDRSSSNHNFEAGLLYRYRLFYISFNATNILNKTIDHTSGFEPVSLTNYHVYSGYVFNTGNRSELEPSFFYQLYQSDGRSSTDLNLKYRKFNKYKDYYWVGFSYRFLNDQIGKPLIFGPLAGFKKGIFTVAYSYQISLNGLTAYNSGNHSITIGFRFLQGLSNCPCTENPVHN